MLVILREVRKADMPLIRKFTAETGWNGIPESQKKILDKEKWSRHMAEVFEGFFKRENSEIFVAEDENQTFLGYLFVGESRNNMIGQTLGFVYDIYVREEFRGKGVGKTLMEKAESYCREKRYPSIVLMVSTENQPAIRLYTLMGFKPEQMYMGKTLT